VQHEDILSEVYFNIAKLVTPPFHFHSEAELISKGLSFEEIYNGPLLKNGFLLDEELMVRSRQIDPSDFIKSVSGIEGILYVKNLKLIDDNNIYDSKPLQLADNEFALFDPELENHKSNY